MLAVLCVLMLSLVSTQASGPGSDTSFSINASTTNTTEGTAANSTSNTTASNDQWKNYSLWDVLVNEERGIHFWSALESVNLDKLLGRKQLDRLADHIEGEIIEFAKANA